MCKRSDTFSLAILIGRGLDLVNLPNIHSHLSFPTFPFPFVQFSGYIPYAPLAQLGEQPKRVRWTMKRGCEVKKQGVMRAAVSRTTMFLREEHLTLL